MPTPRKGETHSDFIARCIPIVIDDGAADGSEQAIAICESLWDDGKTRDQFVSGLERDLSKMYMSKIRSRNRANSQAVFGGLQIVERQTTSWLWDEGAKRYRDAAGKFLSRDDALELALESILESQNAVGTIVDLWSGGSINSGVWNTSYKQVIKDEYIRQYLAGIGGRDRMTYADWGRVGNMLRNQYGYVDNFELDLPGLSDAQIEFRMNMYIKSAHQANERAHGLLAQQWGADTVDWVRDAGAETCETCGRRDAEDPQEIGPRGGYVDPILGIETWPGAGDSECLSSCRCTLKFENSKTGKKYEG